MSRSRNNPTEPPKRHGRRSLMVLLYLALSCSLLLGQAVDEYELKAAFLFNFTRFVEWPAQTNSGGVFVIGIYGDDPFGKTIERAVLGKTIAGRTLHLK